MSRAHSRCDRPRRRTTARPTLELLEDRSTPATLTVNTLTDDTAADGALTLREAITLINAGTTANPGNNLGRDLTAQELAQVIGAFGTEDRIRFASASNTALNGTITITGSELPRMFRSMDLIGPGADALTISGGGTFRAPTPGALFNGELSGLTLTNGPAGDGLIENVGRLSIVNCVVGPTAGTGIINMPESNLAVERSTIRNANRGIENHGILTMTLCTVSNNTRHGLFQQSIFPNSAVIRHCTFSANSSALVTLNNPGAGGIEVAGGSDPILLEHSIVAGNFRASYNPETLLTTFIPSDARGSFAAGSRFNLIGVDGGIASGIAHGVGGNLVGSAAAAIDALLESLAGNDATTPTHALLPGSPARNAGDPAFVSPPATDQRGLPRVADGRIDIGSYEDQLAPPPPPGGIIEGQNFLDLDRDGRRDPGEPGRDGWTIQLFDSAGNLIAEQVTHPIDRDVNGVIEPETERGWYRFTGLAAGSYIIGQVSPPATTQTFPREPVFGIRSDYSLGAHPAASATVDLNRDGKLDLIVASQQPSTLTILNNAGDGTFAATAVIPLGAFPFALATADWDRDGDIDLAVSHGGSSGVSIFRNNGAGTLAFAATYVTGLQPESMVAADLDEDGDLDLATANYFDDSVSILRNQGDGTFAPKDDKRVGDGPVGITAADLEGDGRIDLFVTNFGDGTVSVLRNSVRFGGSDTHRAGSGPGSIVAADFDGDGDPDLAVANVLNSTVTFHRNNGDRTFAPPRVIPLDYGPVGLAAADLDGDGDLDLVAALPVPGSATILINDGTGEFTRRSETTGDPVKRWPKAADFDDDGLADLAFINYEFDSISVLRNLTGRHVVELDSLDDAATGIDFGNVSRVQVVSGGRSDLTAAEGSRVRVPIQYTTTDNDPKLGGLGLRLHFDSSFMTFDGLTGLLTANYQQHQVLPDTSDLDSDPATDSYLLISWADIRGRWPDRTLPTRLFDAFFRLSSTADVGNDTTVRFSASSTAVTHSFAGIPVPIAVVPASLDVDRNGVADALSDGQLIVRSLFGFTGPTLVQDAVAQGATRTDPGELQAYLEQIASIILDADANGVADAMTDGALVQRYLFGFRGAPLIDRVVDPAGSRTNAADIVAFLNQFNPNPFTAPSMPAAPSGPAPAGRQIIAAAPGTQGLASGGRFSVDVHYASDPIDALVGLGLRLHFDSRSVHFDGLGDLTTAGTPLVQVVDDIADFDNDQRTDKFVLTSFFDLLGRFPGAGIEHFATLYSARFTTLPTFAGQTELDFTASSTALGHTLVAGPVTLEVTRPRTVTWTASASGSWFDGNNWSGGNAPRSGDIVVIDPIQPDLTVSIRGGEVFLQGLRNRAALEIADGSLEVIGDALTPVALGDVRILPTGEFTVRNSPVEAVGPCDFQNEGTFRVIGNRMELGAGYSLINRPGGLIEILPGGGDPGLPGGGDPGTPGGGDPGSPGGGDPGVPGGGDPGFPGGGDPGLTADGALIDNFGEVRIGGGGVELTGGSTLRNRSGATFGVDVADGGADPPGAGGNGGGGSSDPPGSGGGAQPGGGPPGSGGGSNPPKASLSADGSTVDNSGRLTFLAGPLELHGNSVMINRPGGVVEMPLPGGGDPGEPAPGGGDPGEPAGGDPVPPTLVDDGSTLDNRSGGIIDLGSTPFEVRGGTVINSGVLTTRGGVMLNAGALSGVGLINGDVTNSGIIRPGLSPGVLTIRGDYTQTAAGVLELEVGGGRAGIDYDQLRVSGASVLGGTQKVTLIGGYLPQPTDQFQFFTASQTSGAFAQLIVAAPGSPGRFALNVGANGAVTIAARPPVIERITVNASKTSKVKSITVVFSEPVSLEPGAFRLRAGNGRIISWIASTRIVNGKTVAVITFPKHRILPQGAYTLTVNAVRISNQMGLALDGDGDGIAGGNRLVRFRSLS